jgi:hypothetical protein
MTAGLTGVEHDPAAAGLVELAGRAREGIANVTLRRS